MNTVDHSDALAGVLGPALNCIQSVVPSELAAVYDLREDRLEARSTVGPLASLLAAQHPIEVARYPELRRAFDDGSSVTLPAQALLVHEAVPSAEHVSLLMPLRMGDLRLGALVLVGRAEAHAAASTALTAASHGLAAALAMARQIETASPLGTTLLPLRKAERLHLLAALRHTGGKIYGRDGAARLLDLKPTTLQSKLKKHGISRLDAVAPSDESTPGSGSSGSSSGGGEPPTLESTNAHGSGLPLREATASPAAE